MTAGPGEPAAAGSASPRPGQATQPPLQQRLSQALEQQLRPLLAAAAAAEPLAVPPTVPTAAAWLKGCALLRARLGEATMWWTSVAAAAVGQQLLLVGQRCRAVELAIELLARWDSSWEMGGRLGGRLGGGPPRVCGKLGAGRAADTLGAALPP